MNSDRTHPSSQRGMPRLRARYLPVLKSGTFLSGLALLLFVAATLGLSPGCGSSSADDTNQGPLIIEFWHAMAGRHSQSLLEIVAAFNERHKDIRVVPVYQGGYDALSQKLVASCISGSNPPIAQMYESWTTRFMSRDLIRSIEELAAEDPPEERIDFNDIIGSLREDNTWVVDGTPTLMSLPFNKSIYVLYVNEDRMRQVGYDEPPKNWQEWKTLAEKMTVRNADGSIEMYGFATRPMLESFTVNLFLQGKKYIDDNGEFDFAGPEGLEALKFLVDLTLGEDRSGYVETSYLNTPFGSGKIAMYVGSTASLPYNESAVGGRFNWRAYPLPEPEGEKGAVLAQGTNVGIFANHSPEVQRAAWQFLKFMTNTENTVKWAIDTGYLPVRYSALESETMQDYLRQNVNYSNALSQVDRARFEPKVIYWESCRLALTREVESALNGRKKPEEALEDALEKAKYIQATE